MNNSQGKKKVSVELAHPECIRRGGLPSIKEGETIHVGQGGTGSIGDWKKKKKKSEQTQMLKRQKKGNDSCIRPGRKKNRFFSRGKRRRYARTSSA